MIADSGTITKTVAERWIKDLDYYVLTDSFAGLIARTSFAADVMKKWTASRKEFVRQAGYTLLAEMLKNGHDAVEDTVAGSMLVTIEKEIHTSPNRARHSMNNALIAIGTWRDGLTEAAIAAAERIGRVEVDHGETLCVTPEAVPYIRKAVARRKKRVKR
jgi:3-methyladenine DNA glycosylase AlkD